MDHSRLLPGRPSSSEGATVATKVLSSHQNQLVPYSQEVPMNIIFTCEMDRTLVTHVGWTEPPHFMVDIQSICISQLKYRVSAFHS